jgi:hypothetical protein
MTFGPANLVFRGSEGGTFTLPLSASPVFATSIGYAGSFTVNWQYRINGGTWASAGSTKSPVYISYAYPLQSSALRTVVNLALKNGTGADPATVVTHVFNSFKGLATGTWAGQSLYYYKPNTKFAQNPLTAADLIQGANHTGNCSAWADLFSQSLGVNGISCSVVMATPRATAYTNDVGFLVKDWTKDVASFPPPYSWQISLATQADMVPVPVRSDYGDLLSSATVPGQNSYPPSEKVFSNHQFVKFGSSYYDASYGVTYTSENDFISKAIFGFAAFYSDNGVTSNLRDRDPMGNLNPSEIQFQ